MNDVMQAVGVFFSYAVLAVFAQNAVFTRGLGVSRLVQLVGDERTSSGWFALLLCVTQVLVAPLAFYAGGFIAAHFHMYIIFDYNLKHMFILFGLYMDVFIKTSTYKLLIILAKHYQFDL